MEVQQFVSLAPWTIIFQIGNLLLLVWLMKKFLFQRVQNILDKRQQEIDGIYEAADADRSSAAELKEEYTRRMATARDEADRLVRSAVDEANRKGDEIVGGAHRQASYIIKKAEGEIAQEKRKAYAELRSDISGLAVDIAEQMVGREINGADQAGLVEDFIRNAGDDK